jgi:hypothetical protein
MSFQNMEDIKELREHEKLLMAFEAEQWRIS